MKNHENISFLLETLAKEIPNNPAILVPRNNTCVQITFRDLNKKSNQLASGLINNGIEKGQRVLLMVPSGIEFIATTFALFKIGAVPVLIDPGLGKKNVLNCISNVKPKAMIAIPLVHAFKFLYPAAFKSIQNYFTVGRRWFWGGPKLNQVEENGSTIFQPQDVNSKEPAAILFTSGSTGPPKGVIYNHRMFYHQVLLLRSLFNIHQGEVDLATFPLFALFSVALGMTSVIPDMDPTQPAKVNPEKMIKHIKDFSITSSFGSPALWETISQYCIDQKVNLSPLNRILMAGAPVAGSLLKRFENILDPDALIFTPYGATEALPVAVIDHRMILSETWEQTQLGKGTCVGKPVEGLELKIISITEEPVSEWDNSLELRKEEIGEVVVHAPWTTQKYFNLDGFNQSSKIKKGNQIWHRMGDVGYLDSIGRLWFCGRKSHRVVTDQKTLFTIPCESIFNTHPEIQRSALVGLNRSGKIVPAIVIELKRTRNINNTQFKNALIEELEELKKENSLVQDINSFLFHPAFPVDIRHNAKINREQLAEWVSRQKEATRKK